MERLVAAVSELTPRLNPAQVRAVARVGVFLRWVAIAFAGLTGLTGPHPPRYLPAVILAAIIYNGAVLAALRGAGDEALGGLALLTTVIDQLFCFAYVAVYDPVPGSQPVAACFPAMIEATAYFGVPGGVLSTVFFVTALLGAQSTGLLLARRAVDGFGVMGTAIIVILTGACLTGVHYALGHPVPHSAPGSEKNGHPAAPTLSARDQRVLQLLAQGYSNGMIADQLGVSERAVKGSVEHLLARLRARNRAEAVAAASRMDLL